eukprot:1157752-Pelagomonas_calceolata.AAC.5
MGRTLSTAFHKVRKGSSAPVFFTHAYHEAAAYNDHTVHIQHNTTEQLQTIGTRWFMQCTAQTPKRKSIAHEDSTQESSRQR